MGKQALVWLVDSKVWKAKPQFHSYQGGRSCPYKVVPQFGIANLVWNN